MRYFMEFSYNGTNYHGWQRQPNALSVQQVLEERSSTLLGSPVALTAAGRTDAGVHARKMLAHFDLEGPFSEDFIARLNAFLPADIAVKRVVPVSDDAHARFDAISRSYEYHLVQEKNPFAQESAWHVNLPLDFDAMNRAAASMMTFKDFKAFSKAHSDVKTYNCEIRRAEWVASGELWIFHITADRFLRNMVRAIVGTLVEVGKGRLTVADVKTIIKSRDRSRAGVSVPAKGLYLTEIVYPDRIYQSNG
ncbi:tRNA pseudouridine(38-40) synthase TruA [Robiginitalea sp. IMCC44478]|uniref:tRNA pseudouridine(38-40) synthase TruA n=1 Tax=Robiginitalea sp. IMCC44478 TaxID=3459122 RepID=UPI004041E17A